MTLRQAPTRNVAVVIVVVLAFAAIGLAVLLSAWMGAVAPAAPMATEELRITDVQFGTGYLTLTVRNTGGSIPVEISEVTVDDLNQTVPPQTVSVNQQIPVGEQRSISVSCEWISGAVYQIRLITVRGNPFIDYAVAP
jgi:hypothetical protein